MTDLEVFEFSPRGDLFPDRSYGYAGDSLWITWEKQRRTQEFAQNLGIRLFRLLYHGPGKLRYPVLAFHTANLIFRHRPKVVFVQNPSLVLAVVAVVLKVVFRFSLVVDRHTNFLINKPDSNYKKIFTLVSDFTLRNSDLTVVTNQPLAELVSAKGGKSFVLPDPLPVMPLNGAFSLDLPRNVCFICTFAGDEPYEEVIASGADLPPDVGLLITGNSARANLSVESRAILAENRNVTLTGYLSEEAYSDLLNSVDVVMDLTTFDCCLVCGAYEGISAGKVLVLSDKEANVNLFGEAPIYVGPTRAEISRGILTALSEMDARLEKTRQLKITYGEYWQHEFSRLLGLVSSLAE